MSERTDLTRDTATRQRKGMSLIYWPSTDERLYEPAGGRCLCDECCAARPERLLERAEVRKRLDRLVKDSRYDKRGG